MVWAPTRKVGRPSKADTTLEAYQARLHELGTMKSQLLQQLEEADRHFKAYMKAHEGCKPHIARYVAARKAAEAKRQHIITKIEEPR